jgi:hypothetical protein
VFEARGERERREEQLFSLLKKRKFEKNEFESELVFPFIFSKRKILLVFFIQNEKPCPSPTLFCAPWVQSNPVLRTKTSFQTSSSEGKDNSE